MVINESVSAVDSHGSSPEAQTHSVFSSAEFTYLMWFLLGIIAHFGLQLFVLSASVYADVLEIQLSNVGAFEANAVSTAVTSAALGFFLAMLFIPFKTIMLEYLMLTLMLMMLLLCVVNMMSMWVGWWMYGMAIVFGCLAIGAIETVGIGSANDPGLPGKASKRVIFFICGHPIGYLLAMLIHIFMHQSWFATVLEMRVTVGWAYGAYGILVMVFISPPPVLYILKYNYPMNMRRYTWQNANLIKSRIFYREAQDSLGAYAHYIAMILVVEVIEGLLNTRSVLVLTDPFPEFKSTVASLLLLIMYTLFDFLGRGMSIGVRKLVEYRKGRWNILVELGKEKEVEEYGRKLNMMENGTSMPVDDIPEVNDRKRILRYAALLTMLWLIIGFRLLAGLVMSLRRHFADSRALKPYSNPQCTIILTAFNALARGFIVSYVHSNIFAAARKDYLDLHNVTLRPVENEPLGCVDMRHNADITAALVVTIVRYIELTTLMIALYVGYKYNRLLFDAEMLRSMEEAWPTDHLSNDFAKLCWWVKNVALLIWRDVRSPFDML